MYRAKMNDKEKEVFKQWIIENVDDTIVPADEGDGAALAYNLIQRLYHGKGAALYSYTPEQDKELRAMGLLKE